MPTIVRAKLLLALSDELGRSTRICDGFVLYEGTTILDRGVFRKDIATGLESRYGDSLKVIRPLDHRPPARLHNSEHHVPVDGKWFCHDAILLPGFVKAHGHDHEAPIIGVGRDLPLTEWLDEAINVFTSYIENRYEVFVQAHGFSPNRLCYEKARLDDIYYGITSTMVHQCNYAKNHVEELIEVNEQAGTHMTIAVGSQDRNFYEKVLDTPRELAVHRLDRYRELVEHSEHTRIIPGPDQCFSNSPKMLKMLKTWANKHDSLVHIHSSEEPNTTAWFCKKYGMTPVQYLDSVGFLDSKTLLAHQVNCTEEDLDLLVSRGAMIAHNPTANTILGSGMPPVLEFLERGIPVAVATDGSGSSDNQNMIAATRLASQYQKALHQDARVLPAQKALELITVEPAQILGLNAGQLDPGKSADLILVDTRRPNLTPTRASNAVENLIWSADGSEIDTVIAGGKLLLHNKRYQTLDATRILGQTEEFMEEFDTFKAEMKTPSGTGAPRSSQT